MLPKENMGIFDSRCILYNKIW